MKKIIIIIGIVLFAYKTYAKANTDFVVTTTVNKTSLSDCAPSTSQIDLDINNVRVTLLAGGDMWWDGSNEARYQYPKIDQTSGEAPKNVLFLGALWLTGYEAGTTNLKCSAQRYRNDGHDYYSGPLQNFGLITSATCNAFDHHFVVYGDEILEFQTAFNETGNVPESEIPLNILIWPGKGNKYLQNSSNETYNSWYFDESPLAPFFDYDGNGYYSPEGGDYPVIKSSYDSITGISKGHYADQMIFWVVNDEGNIHTNSQGTPIGVQVNCLAFAFRTSDELNDMTFYTYEFLKKTSGDLTDTYMSIVTDPDIGAAADDFIGCDIERSVGYCYNGDMDDVEYGTESIPFIGIDFFEGPIDSAGVELGMSSFMYYNNTTAPDPKTTDPSVPEDYRGFQLSLWKDGTPLTIGGYGMGATNPPTVYAYPVSGTWTECGEGNTPADRRFIQTSGPFVLKSSQIQRISIGVMIAEMTTECPDLTGIMLGADDKAQALFDNNFSIIDGPDAPVMKIREIDGELIVNLINEKSSNNYGENYSSEAVGASNTNNPDYDFEGYLVYQLKNSTVTSTSKDLSNPDKARLVYQSDVKNGVSKVYNYDEYQQELDDIDNYYIPVIKADGADEGITKSFTIDQDLFATGGTDLVNYKKYYFTVVAYAYNNFRQYNPNTPDSLMQREQYLPGRRTTVYSAIPHNIASESNGTILNSKFGQGVVVRRLEGQGNGGRNIELMDDTKLDIVENSFKDILTYKPLFDPIGIKIIDPLTVQDVNFELLITDEANVVSDSSTWVLNVYNSNASLKETIVSNRPIDRPYDQIIEEYGIVVRVGKPVSINVNLLNGNSVYDFISGTISYEDENKKWLTFFTDNEADNLDPSNWVGSGEFVTLPTERHLYGVWDSHQYDDLSDTTFYDINNDFTYIFEGGFSPYCLANNHRKDADSLRFPGSHSAVAGDDDKTITEPYSTFAPGFIWDRYTVNREESVMNPINTLDKLRSVDIVMTSDKSKWTKCVVFETSDATIYNKGNARKGQLRASTSIDEDGNDIIGELGRSYFPGYAINVENGERLNIAFGEASSRSDNNGDDMIWNPTSKVYDKSTTISLTADYPLPVYGGQHFIYVFDTKYDKGDAALSAMANYKAVDNAFAVNNIPSQVQDLYKNIMYTSIPLLQEGSELLSLAEGIIPNDDTIRIRVERPYGNMFTTETNSERTNDTMPRYSFSTEGLAPTFNDAETAESVLDNIRVVPNPYYAFSDYEENPNSTIVKLTNLPDKCDVSIYTMDGKLVKKFERAFGADATTETGKQDLSLGQELGVSNLNNSLIWNLKNHRDISVGSGTYLIYVDAPGIGQKVVKSVVFVRPPDITNF